MYPRRTFLLYFVSLGLVALSSLSASAEALPQRLAAVPPVERAVVDRKEVDGVWYCRKADDPSGQLCSGHGTCEFVTWDGSGTGNQRWATDTGAVQGRWECQCGYGWSGTLCEICDIATAPPKRTPTRPLRTTEPRAVAPTPTPTPERVVPQHPSHTPTPTPIPTPMPTTRPRRHTPHQDTLAPSPSEHHHPSGRTRSSSLTPSPSPSEHHSAPRTSLASTVSSGPSPSPSPSSSSSASPASTPTATALAGSLRFQYPFPQLGHDASNVLVTVNGITPDTFNDAASNAHFRAALASLVQQSLASPSNDSSAATHASSTTHSAVAIDTTVALGASVYALRGVLAPDDGTVARWAIAVHAAAATSTGSGTVALVQLQSPWGSGDRVTRAADATALQTAIDDAWSGGGASVQSSSWSGDTVRGLPGSSGEPVLLAALVGGLVGGALLTVAIAAVILGVESCLKPDRSLAEKPGAEWDATPPAAPVAEPPPLAVAVPPAPDDDDDDLSRPPTPRPLLSNEPLDPNAFLRDLTRERLVRLMLYDDAATPRHANTLVVDAASRQILLAAFSAEELRVAGYSRLLSIEQAEQEQEGAASPMVVLIEPASRTVDQVLALRSQQRPIAGVYFTYAVDADLFAVSPRQRLLTAVSTEPSPTLPFAVHDVNVHFAAIEQRVFTLPEAGTADIATALFTACCVLGEVPRVRYLAPSETARAVAERLARLLRKHPEMVVNDSRLRQAPRARATVILVPRTVDLIAPLLHALSYEALVQDLLPSPTDEAAATFMDENRDDIWRALRFVHVTEATRRLIELYHEACHAGGVRATSVFDLHSLRREVQSRLRDQEEAASAAADGHRWLASVDFHASMLEQLLQHFHQRGLQQLLQVEQALATRRQAPTGAALRDDEARTLVWERLQANGADVPSNSRTASIAYDSLDKLRVVLLYLLTCHSEPEADSVNMLVQSGAVRAVEAPAVLRNVRQLREMARREQEALRRSVRAAGRQRAALDTVGISERYVPLMRDLIEDTALDALPYEAFPLARGHSPPSRSRRAAAAAARLAAGSMLLTSLFRRVLPGASSNSGGGGAEDDFELDLEAEALRRPSPSGSGSDEERDRSHSPRLSGDSQHTGSWSVSSSSLSPASSMRAGSLASSAAATAGASSADVAGSTAESEGAKMRPRTLLFVLGGVSTNEVRAAYDISERRERNVMIGGAERVEPARFAERLVRVSSRRAPTRE